jgi:cytidylate kinase
MKPAPALGFTALAVSATMKFFVRASRHARARRAPRAKRFFGVVERRNGY